MGIVIYSSSSSLIENNTFNPLTPKVKHQIRVEYERAQNNPNDSESNTGAVGDSMSHQTRKSNDHSLAPVMPAHVRSASPRYKSITV